MAGGPAGSGGGIESGSKVIGFIIAVFAAFGGVLFGYDTGTISGLIAMDDWLNTFGTYDSTGTYSGDSSLGYYLKTNNKSLVVSILSVGTFFGALAASPVADLIGRRFGLIFGSVVFSVGVGLQLDTSWGAFVAGRVIAGLGVGLVSCQVPMYQSETAPKALRGLIMGCYQLSVTIGALIATIVLNATKDRANHTAWRIPIAIQFAWAGILIIGMALLPETPRHLLNKGKEAAARRSLARLTGLPADSPAVDAEVAEINAALVEELEGRASSYKDCFTRGASQNLLRTMTGITIQAMQQLTGINFIIYYGTTFFEQSGITNAFVISIAVSVVNTGMTIIGINLIDRVGRRKLLIWGAVGMSICEFIVAIVGTAAGSTSQTAGKCLVAFTCIYVALYAISWGPVPWCITGEIFPNSIRAKSVSLSTASNWLWNWGIGYATPYLVDPSTTGVNAVKTADLGAKVFFIWGATCAGCAVWSYFLAPETKGLSLEQIDILYRETSPRKSAAYNKEMQAVNETFTNHVVPTDGYAEKKGAAAEVEHA
ncbi:Plasma membrane low glucose sensor [Cryptotrichosporon argae]